MKLPFCGYYTTDLIEKNIRRGYVVNNLKGRKGIFAHENSSSDIKISKFGVDLDVFELIAVKQIEECLEYFPNKVVIMDEVGKKEFLSSRFRKIFEKALASPNIVIASVTLRKNIQFDRYFNRDDSLVFEINQNNRSLVKENVMEIVNRLWDELELGSQELSYYAKLMEN